ncbi:hypothetical protein AN219_21920, partial [Streptomyces nanshensis]
MADAGAAASRPQQAAYGPPDPRDSSEDGAFSWHRDEYKHGYGRGSSVRGGHPEHREPGGGW